MAVDWEFVCLLDVARLCGVFSLGRRLGQVWVTSWALFRVFPSGGRLCLLALSAPFPCLLVGLSTYERVVAWGLVRVLDREVVASFVASLTRVWVFFLQQRK